MDFASKFNLIISTIEESLTKPGKKEEVFYDISNKLFTTPRIVGDCFNFITNMTLGEYIKRRKLAVAFMHKMENQLKWEDVYYQVGYSEASSFQRSFKNTYNMTPREMEERGAYDMLTQPISLEEIGFTKRIDEANMPANEESASVDNISTDLLYKVLNVAVEKPNVKVHEFASLLYDIEACASIFGLDVDTVINIYRLSLRKTNIYCVCGDLSEKAFGIDEAQFNELDEKKQFLLVNFGFYEHALDDALMIFKDFSVEEMLEMDIGYMLTLYMLNWGAHYIDEEEGSVGDILSEYEYKKIKREICRVIKRDRIDCSDMEATLMLASNNYNDVHFDLPIVDAICRLILNSEDEDVNALINKEQIEPDEENTLRLVIYHNMKYRHAKQIVEKVLPAVGGDIDAIDETYIDYINFFSEFANMKISVEKYNEHIITMREMEEAEARGENPFADGIKLDYEALREMRELEDEERRQNRNRIRQIAEKYGIDPGKVLFAEEICNSYVSLEKAYELMGSCYQDKVMVEAEGKEGLTIKERLTIILSLNTDKSISECEEVVEKHLAQVNWSDYQLKEYLFINKRLSSSRSTEHFELVDIDCYILTKVMVRGTILENAISIAIIIKLADNNSEEVCKAFYNNRRNLEGHINEESIKFQIGNVVNQTMAEI